jgi:hypothetical protein
VDSELITVGVVVGRIPERRWKFVYFMEIKNLIMIKLMSWTC